jgi:sugar phosphate isomerase/epimerase
MIQVQYALRALRAKSASVMKTNDSTNKLGKIGIGSWTFPWAVGTIPEQRPVHPLTPADLVRKARMLGAGVVQVVDNLPLDQVSQSELDAFRVAAGEAGIELEIGTRGVQPSHLERYLEIAHSVRARLVRTMCGWHGAPPPLIEVERNLKEVLPNFEKAGIRVALENYEAYSTRDLANLIQAIDSPNLGVCLDLTNSFGALESAEEILDALVPLTLNVHLKEFTIERIAYLMGFEFRGRPTGTGRLPIEKIFSRLHQAGRTPNVIVELWTPFAGSLEETLELEESWARQSVAFLKELHWFGAPGPRS